MEWPGKGFLGGALYQKHEGVGPADGRTGGRKAGRRAGWTTDGCVEGERRATEEP